MGDGRCHILGRNKRETGVAIVTSVSSLFLGSPWDFSSLWMDDEKGFSGL